MTTEEKNSQNHIQGLERGFMVLGAFSAESPHPTASELAAATRLSRPVVRRVLLTLQRLGYVESADGRWKLTPRVLSIGQHYTAANALIDIAQPYLAELADRIGESAALAALDGNEVVYLARVAVRRVLSSTASAGTRVAPHATSLGRVLLAWEPDVRVDQVISEYGLPALTPHTVTDPAAFRKALALVRAQGWSMVVNEREEGLLAVSAPVRDKNGHVVAAVATATTTGRISPERSREKVIPVLVDVADRLSETLSLDPPMNVGART